MACAKRDVSSLFPFPLYPLLFSLRHDSRSLSMHHSFRVSRRQPSNSSVSIPRISSFFYFSSLDSYDSCVQRDHMFKVLLQINSEQLSFSLSLSAFVFFHFPFSLTSFIFTDSLYHSRLFLPIVLLCIFLSYVCLLFSSLHALPHYLFSIDSTKKKL